MSEILICNQPLQPKILQHQCSIKIDDLSALSCEAPMFVAANTPYLIGNDPSGIGRKALAQLSSPDVSRELANLSLSFGADNVLALAEINAKLKEYSIGLLGASDTVYNRRIGGFIGSVQEYQAALMKYRDAARSGSPLKIAMKQKAHVAFKKMQSQFRNELNIVNAKVKARRGTPLPVRKEASI